MSDAAATTGSGSTLLNITERAQREIRRIFAASRPECASFWALIASTRTGSFIQTETFSSR